VNQLIVVLIRHPELVSEPVLNSVQEFSEDAEMNSA